MVRILYNQLKEGGWNLNQDTSDNERINIS
jgi:hypothetical protein